MPGEAKLPDDEYVERRTQCPRDLESDRYPTPREREYNYVAAIGVLAKRGSEPLASLAPVAKASNRVALHTDTVAAGRVPDAP